MLKYILTSFLFIAGFIGTLQEVAFAQTRSGMVVYSSRISLETRNIYTDTLKFTRRKSIFLWHQDNKKEVNKRQMKKVQQAMRKNAPAAAMLRKTKTITKTTAPTDTIGRYNLYSVAKDSLYSRREIVEQIYLLKAKKPQINWNITSSTKKIGKFTCTKATTHFRGRNYTAWFTPEIPLPYGPWKLVGLPGLILQAYDSQKNIYFTAQKVLFNNAGMIGSMPLSGKEEVIGLAQYKKLMTHLMEHIKQHAHETASKFIRKLKVNHPNINAGNVTVKIAGGGPNPMEIFGKDAE